MIIGSKLFGQLTRGFGLARMTLLRRREERYRIEVRSRGGELLCEVPEFFDDEYVEKVNTPATLTFSVDEAAACADHLEPPNRVWLYDVTGSHVQTFVIWGHTIQDDGAGRWRVLDCQDLLSLLGVERLVTDLEVLSGTQTVRETLLELLGRQQNSPAITLGAVDTSIANLERGVKLDGQTSVLSALQDLVASVGGYFWTTPQGGLNWRLRRGRDAALFLEEGKNLRGVTVEHDHHDGVNRVYYYGQREGDTWLTLTDGGYATEYMDADGLGGDDPIHVGVVHDSDVSDPDELIRRAEYWLETHAVENPTYRLDVIDLSHDPAHDYDERLSIGIGDTVTAVHDELPSGGLRTEIKEVRRRLQDPLATSVIVGRLPRTLLDELVDVQMAAEAEPDVEVAPIRIENIYELADWVGLRDGTLIFDESEGEMSMLRLDPQDGRLPDADWWLEELGGDPLHRLESGQVVNDIEGVADGDIWHRRDADGSVHWGGATVDPSTAETPDGTASEEEFMKRSEAEEHFEGDGSVWPYWARTFRGSALANIDALAEGENPVTFRESDQARTDDGMYVRNDANDGWVRQVRVHEADTEAELPDVDGPALGHVPAHGTGEGAVAEFYYERHGDSDTGEWKKMQTGDDVGLVVEEVDDLPSIDEGDGFRVVLYTEDYQLWYSHPSLSTMRWFPLVVSTTITGAPGEA